MLEDILSNISELPDLEDVDNELIEITIDNDLSELKDFVSDTEEMPPLEEIPNGECLPNNEPIRREERRYVLE